MLPQDYFFFISLFVGLLIILKGNKNQHTNTPNQQETTPEKERGFIKRSLDDTEHVKLEEQPRGVFLLFLILISFLGLYVWERTNLSSLRIEKLKKVLQNAQKIEQEAKKLDRLLDQLKRLTSKKTTQNLKKK